jgi:hypothetical protein
MTIVTALVVLLLAIIATLSLQRIAALPVAPGLRVILISLRILLVALLAIAFFEPAMVFERLPSRQQSVAVLIDESKSMQTFSPDSTIAPYLSALEHWNRLSDNRQQQFVFYSFGDSLRRLVPGEVPAWSDRRSFFPEHWGDRQTHVPSSMIIITDGNWSNTSSPAGFFADKNVWYVPLSSKQEFPWLRIDPSEFPERSAVDSPLVITATIEGSAFDSGKITVTAREKNRLLTESVIAVKSGYFKKEVKIRLGSRTPGPHLYRFDAVSMPDSLVDSRYALHTAVPSRFSYAISRGTPSLDRRFIRLALQRRNDFFESTSPKTASLDLLVVTERPPSGGTVTETLKRKGVALFFGCLPCSTVVTELRGPVRFVATPPFEDLDFPALPPLARLFSFVNKNDRPGRAGVVLNALPANGRGFDTVPLIYTTRFSRFPAIVCALPEPWIWDFSPPGMHSDEERVFILSDRLLNMTADAITAALSNTLLVYPAARCLVSDSIAFRVAFPAALPAGTPVSMSLSMNGDLGRTFDTSFTIEVTGSARQGFTFRPIEPAGAYRLEVRANANNDRFSFTDSLQVNQDRSEYLTSSQNTQMLSEMALRFDSISDRSIRERFFSEDATAGKPVQETVHLRRGWILLVFIFLVMATEWGLRRFRRLD